MEIPDKLVELFEGSARYRVAYGGRGSGKSWTFARLLIIRAMEKKIRILCARELQNSVKDSVHKLLSDQIWAMGLQDYFDIGESFIRCNISGSDFIFKGLRNNTQEIKSMENIGICWIEEAQSVSDRSFDLLTPTIRGKGSEIWITFNPENEDDPVWQRFVEGEPTNSKVAMINYDDNPWFPDELEQERLDMLNSDPTKYEHVWGGGFNLVNQGAYYADYMVEAKNQNRITKVPYEPLLKVETHWDLGMDDATAIWFVQYHGMQIRVIDYYEHNGVGLEHYAEILEQKGYKYSKHYAPHDIRVRELGSGNSRIETARKLGINFDITPNIPVNDGIQAVRNLLPLCWFDGEKCKEGVRALQKYRREYDDQRNVFKNKPLHDWSSNGADAFRYMAVNYRESRALRNKPLQTRIYKPKRGL